MNFSLLVKAPVFKGFSVKEVERLLVDVHYRSRKFRAGSVIAQSGAPLNSLMLVMDGKTKGEMIDYSGRVIKIEDIPAPGALAPAFIFGNKNCFPVTVLAVSDVELMIIERSDFLKLMMMDDRILVNFLDMISNRSQFLSEKIKFLSFKTIKGKLAQYLLQKAGKDSTSLELLMTQKDIAGFFGVARPSIGRALGEMKKEGLIEARGKKIRIINKVKLAGLTTD